MDNFSSPLGMCSWKMDPGPTTTWRDGTKKSRRSLERVTSTSLMVELFKLEQASTEVGLRQLMAGGALMSLPPKQRNKERRLKKIQKKFDNGDYTLANYLSA